MVSSRSARATGSSTRSGGRARRGRLGCRAGCSRGTTVGRGSGSRSWGRRRWLEHGERRRSRRPLIPRRRVQVHRLHDRCPRDPQPLGDPRLRHALRSQPPDQRPVLQSDHTPIVECSLFTAETVQFSRAVDTLIGLCSRPVAFRLGAFTPKAPRRQAWSVLGRAVLPLNLDWSPKGPPTNDAGVTGAHGTD